MKPIYLCLLLICTGNCFAQNLIHGSVKDAEGENISFANVLILNPSDSSLVTGEVATEEGEFEIKNVKDGRYLLVATMLGYEKSSQDLLLNRVQKDYPVDLTLAKSSLNLDEVQVVAKRPLYEKHIDRMVVNVQDNVSTIGNSALDLLAKTPGLDVDRIGNTISLIGKLGVSVMVNGKLIRLEGASLVQFLQGLSSVNIQNIEIYTTPPANFDAQGDAGIINIITLQNPDEGLNGTLTLQGGYGVNWKYGGASVLNYRKDKVYFYMDVSSNNDHTQQDARIRTTNLENGSYNDVHTLRPAYIGLHRLNAGLDYELSKKTTIGTAFTAYMRDWQMTAESFTNNRDEKGNNYQYYQLSHEVNQWTNGTINLNIRHQFNKKHALNVDYDYLKYYDDNPSEYFEEEKDEFGSTINTNESFSTKQTPINFHVFKLDYSWSPQEGLNIEAGIKKTISHFKNDVGFAVLNDDVPVYTEDFTDVFRMDEDINAAYLSLSYQITSKLLFKPGLRYERNITYLESDQEGEIVDRDIPRLFPTFFLTYELSKKSTLGLSYTKRITRPGFNALAPAYYFFDRNTIIGGNASLQSTITEQYKIDFNLGAFSSSLQYSDEDHPIAWGSRGFNDHGVMVIGVFHLEDRKVASINMNYSFEPTKWWSVNVNAGAYWQREEAIDELRNQVFDRKYFTANMTQEFTMANHWVLELGARYRSPRQFGVNVSPGQGSLNLGVQKEFKNHSKLSLSWNDLFNLGSFYHLKSDENTGVDTFDMQYDVEGNVVQLVFSMPFGNKALKSKRREAASADERSRVD